MTNVEVVIPEVKLNLADLSFLRGLMPGHVRCTCPSNKTRDKLLFLGLIQEGDIAPESEDVKAWEKKQQEALERCTVAFKAKNWDAVHSASYDIRYPRRPESHRGYLITRAGLDLIKNGHAKTQISKKGCV